LSNLQLNLTAYIHDSGPKEWDRGRKEGGIETLVIGQQLSSLHLNDNAVNISPKMMKKGQIDSSFPQRQPQRVQRIHPKGPVGSGREFLERRLNDHTHRLPAHRSTTSCTYICVLNYAVAILLAADRASQREGGEQDSIMREEKMNARGAGEVRA